MTTRWTALALMALTLAVAGCGGDDSEDKAASPTTETTRTQTADTRNPGKPRPSKDAARARQEARDKEQSAREEKDLQKDDREFDRAFKETPFERLVNKLPIREPPLFVEQYITGEGHKIYTAVDRGRFCKMSAAGREKAVKAFFDAADRSFRRAGVNDFEQVVTPLSDTIDELPALATARRGEVALTSRGRNC